MNLIGHLQGMSNHILAIRLFTIPWIICVHGFQSTRLWKEMSFIYPYSTPGIKIKIKNLITHLQDILNHIQEYYLSTFWNDRNLHCSILIWPKGAKWKFQILTAHLQDMLNHTLEYQLSTPENIDAVQVNNFAKKNKVIVCRPSFDPSG